MGASKRRRRAKARRIRIMLAGGEALLVEAFQALLETEFHVLGTVTDGRSLVHQSRKHKPDVIVLEATLPPGNGLDAGRELLAVCPSAKLVYLTNNQEPKLVAEALRFGATGYVSKSATASELKSAIRAAATGPPRQTGTIAVPEMKENGSEHLTTRQKEVLQLIAGGRSMKEVAEVLHVTPRTVAFHKYNMMDRLRLKSTAELVQFAVKNGVIGATAVISN